MDIVVKELVIEKDRTEHISKHDVTETEVREVIDTKYAFFKGKRGRWILIGQTKEGRVLAVIVGLRETEGKYVKKGTIKPVKPFKSLEEEANFWDTHSVLDEIDEGTMVGFHQANKTDTLTIRFTSKDIEKLREQAFTKGIGPTTLARMWIKDKLNKDAKSHL